MVSPDKATGVPLRVSVRSTAVNVSSAIGSEKSNRWRRRSCFAGSGATGPTAATIGPVVSITHESDAEPVPALPAGSLTPLATTVKA